MLGVVVFAVGGSYPKISDNLSFLKFAISKNLFQVVIDSPDIYVVELPHHLLSEPDVLISVNGFDATLAACGDKGQIFPCR